METVTPITKNILILSYGPVPTPEFQKIEGGGMRCWGLATGLRDNGHSVTVSVFEEFKQNIKIHENIRLHNWQLNDEFKTYMNSYDVVIVSYSMGDLSMFVADHLSHHITLVLDCYVPIFIEISARDSQDKASELRGYLHEIKRFNHVLQRGDFFLCANEPQKHMYAGILGSLGVINPYSYRQNRLLMVPFGVENNVSMEKLVSSNPYKSKKDDFVLLWFGGLYPWFNFKPLIKAIEKLSDNPRFKFYLVGGKNPYNNHPDFVKQYNYVVEKFTSMGLIGKSVFIVDWIDFSDRGKWFKNADLVISINSPGEENIYSWRTRVIDFVWGELPMISNGGDPLSDELIASGAGLKVDLSTETINETINNLINKPGLIKSMKSILVKIKTNYTWDRLTKELSDQLGSGNNLPYVDGLSFIEENKILSLNNTNAPRKITDKLRKSKSLLIKAKNKGIKRSTKFAVSILSSKFKAFLTKSKLLENTQKAFFLSHPIDHTGAPLVLLDVIEDFGKGFKSKDINIVAPAIQKDLVNKLLQKDYKILKMVDGIGGRIIQAALNISPNDFVLMNTIAVYQNYKEYVYWMLESGRLNRAHWFIHEDKPEIRFGNKKEIARIKKLIKDGKLRLLVPSKQTAIGYNEFFETKSVKSVVLRVEVPKKYQKPRDLKDFDTIKFFMSGIPLDGRKGQLLFLAALQQFESKYKNINADQYRPYTLDLVAMGKDYISEQISSIGSSIMGNRLRIHPVVTRDKALEITSSCNVTVCSSLNETFALFVAEGMLMGHPIIRNDTSGWQEQIKDGQNGFMFKTLELDSLTECIRKILSKDLTNTRLVDMSKSSEKIARSFSKSNYYQQIIREES